MTTAEWIAQQKRKAGVPTGLTGNAAATVSSLNASRAQQQALIDEAAARARSQAIAQSDAAARAKVPASNTTPPQPTQSAGMSLSGINYGNVDKRGIDNGFRTANDADRQMWARIAEAYNSGDQAQVHFLLNTMQGQGNFSGYYGDDGLYYGYVRGNNGAANGSYQPVIGGKLISTGELDTNQWLTPNGQVWTGSLGGPLSNTGGTWSYGSTTPARTKAGGTAASPTPVATTSPASTTPTAYEQAISAVSDTTPANPYGESQPDSMWQRYLAAYDSQPAPEYGGSEYTALRDEATRRAADPFAYDYNLDPVWQAYRKEYTREGRRASEDALGQYSSLTGGRASTAAMTAAQQAGSYYSSQLADKIPELYASAYQRYLQDYQKQLGIAGAYDSYAQQDYNQYLNRLGQWNTDRSFNYNAYRDAVSDQRYDQQWQQNLREYADSQGWKAAEWEQYLKEYGNKLSEQDREWVYKMARDAVEDERYEEKWNYGVEQDDYSQRRQQAIDAINYFGDYTKLAQLLGIDTTGMSNDQVKYILVDRGVVDEAGKVTENAAPVTGDTSSPRYKQSANTPDYLRALTDFDQQGRSIVNNAWEGMPSDLSHAFPGITTWQQAHSYLVSHGIDNKKYSPMSESTFNKQKDVEGSDAYGYATYQDYLLAYLAYAVQDSRAQNNASAGFALDNGGAW